MALKKSILTRQNVLAEYWTIPSVDFNKEARRAVARMHLYKDQSSYDADAMPMLRDVCTIVLQGGDFDHYFGDGNANAAFIQQQMYLAAKEKGTNADYGVPIQVNGKYNGLRNTFDGSEDV